LGLAGEKCNGDQRRLERKEEVRHTMVKSLSMSTHRTMTNPAQAFEEELISQPFFLVMPKQFIKNQYQHKMVDHGMDAILKVSIIGIKAQMGKCIGMGVRIQVVD